MSNLVKVETGDFFIAKHKGKPALMVKLAGAHRGVLEHTLHNDEPESVNYEPELVLCNLGKDPAPNTYCSVHVRPYVKTVPSNKYGPVIIRTKLDNKDRKALSDAMAWVYDWYKKHATVAFLPLHQVFLYPPKGKYAGCYKARSRGSETFDVMELHPKSFSDPIYNRYLVAHEFAHGLFFRCVPRDIRARWMRLYQKRLKLSKIKSNRMEELWLTVSSYDGGLSAYLKESADDEERLLLKEVIGYFRRNHRMAADDITMLLDNNRELLKSLWPSSATLTEERPDMGSYAMKSYEEMFAEAMAYHITGKKVPNDILAGIEYTLKKCKRTLRDD